MNLDSTWTDWALNQSFQHAAALILYMINQEIDRNKFILKYSPVRVHFWKTSNF